MGQEKIIATAPGSVSDLLNILDGSIDSLPKRLRQCAVFTRRNLHLIAVSTVSELAEAAGVAPSVYMRFCQSLGFSGYSEMQAMFRARYTEYRPGYEDRLAALQQDGTVELDRLLADFAEAGHKSIMSLANSVIGSSLERIAEGMAQARVVHLIGLRRAFPIVSNMYYLLDKLEIPANLHFGTGMMSSGKSIFPGDVLFAVTYAPFSEETTTLVKEAEHRGVTVYGLTESERCPLSQYATEMLIARENEVAGFRSLNASMTLTTALAVAVKTVQQRR